MRCTSNVFLSWAFSYLLVARKAAKKRPVSGLGFSSGQSLGCQNKVGSVPSIIPHLVQAMDVQEAMEGSKSKNVPLNFDALFVGTSYVFPAFHCPESLEMACLTPIVGKNSTDDVTRATRAILGSGPKKWS